MKKETAFRAITARLSELTRPELKDLRTMIETLLYIEAVKDQERQGKPLKALRSNRGATGHIERKLINGYGPYLYLRFKSGTTLKSQYIGKAVSPISRKS